jgi:hypothetical protein
MTGLLMNYKLESMYKEAIAAYFLVLSQNLPEGLRKAAKILTPG